MTASGNPLGGRMDWTWPWEIEKFSVAGFPIFTVRGAVPIFLIVRLPDSVGAVFPKVICLKERLAGVILI